MAWRFDELMARPLQDFHAIGLNDNDVIELAQSFHTCGFWRAPLEEGLFFWTPHIFRIFEMEPHSGPVNVQCVFAAIHVDDRPMLLEAYQRSCETGQTFHSIYRIHTKRGSLKWVRTVGMHHTRPDGGAELRGMLHELFPHIPTAGFVTDEC